MNYPIVFGIIRLSTLSSWFDLEKGGTRAYSVSIPAILLVLLIFALSLPLLAEALDHIPGAEKHYLETWTTLSRGNQIHKEIWELKDTNYWRLTLRAVGRTYLWGERCKIREDQALLAMTVTCIK